MFPAAEAVQAALPASLNGSSNIHLSLFYFGLVYSPSPEFQ